MRIGHEVKNPKRVLQFRNLYIFLQVVAKSMYEQVFGSSFSNLLATKRTVIGSKISI